MRHCSSFHGVTAALCALSVSACTAEGVRSVRDIPPRMKQAQEEPPPVSVDPIVCTCPVNPIDRDGDCVFDEQEDTNKNGAFDPDADFSDLMNPDSDGDGITDGCEDIDRDGFTDEFPPESSPRHADSDGDGLADGLEDKNRNGYYDFGETSPTRIDTDADGIPDGIEDRNQNGERDCGPAEAPTLPTCETNPADVDTDHDSLTDFVELKTWYDPAAPTFDFVSGAPPAPDCAGPNGFKGVDPLNPLDDQTCPWHPDSDADGVLDGYEDANGNGFLNSGESDPHLQDSDLDGLPDGVEDANKDGFWDGATETNPTSVDTDADGLSDGIEDSGGCVTIEVNGVDACGGEPVTGDHPCVCANWRNGLHDDNEADPRIFDTDADGLKDGLEDRNGDGVCQKPKPRAIPRASDESCAFLRDSDGDNLADGTEDQNANAQIDFGETDPRRGDSDNDCLVDSYELLVGTEPFINDTDEDGLPDGLESAERLIFDGNECVHLSCASGSAYVTATCPNPLVRDSDGDGAPDGFEPLNGVRTGEDENKNGCVDPGESSPCAFDVPQPPAPGDYACQLSSCSPNALSGCVDPTCLAARKSAQALVCADGNVRPVSLLRSEENDYALALPATRGDIGDGPQSLFGDEPLELGGGTIGHAFQSNDSLSEGALEPVRGVYGAIVRLATLSTGAACSTVLDAAPLVDSILPPPTSGVCPLPQSYIVWSASLTPTDVAERAARRISAQLGAAGYVLERTSGGNALAHDDETRIKPDGSSIFTATDIFSLERTDGEVDAAEIEQITTSAILGGAAPLRRKPALAARTGPRAELRVQYYRRIVSRREADANGMPILTRIAQYGAVIAVAPLTESCAAFTGADRLACKKRLEPSLLPVADLTNGSALSRFQASVGHRCDAFNPARSKADFLLGIDDSGSMQEYILAIQRAVREVAFKLQANTENMDWRIAFTTSSMGQGDDSGPRLDLEPTALADDFVPATDHQGDDHGYPALVPGTSAVPIFFAYQTTAFDTAGYPQRCTYAERFDPSDPTKSPYCCDMPLNTPDGDFVSSCCSLPVGTQKPAGYATVLSLTDPNNATFGPQFDPKRNDTLRCYDIPRFGQEPGTPDEPDQVWPYIRFYSTGNASSNAPTITQDNDITSRHFADSLCGQWQLSKNQQGAYALTAFLPPKLWGARGHLWPPGFVGPDANPRKNGANLLVRNADMLVVQMNRRCYTHGSVPGLELPAPRAFQDAGAEQLLQAVKRAIQRSTTAGRGLGSEPLKLRTDAPLISLLVSDEEDYSLKFHDDSAERPHRPFLAERDRNALPAATCESNGDAGCTVAYCQDVCFADWIDQGDPLYRIPAARRYSAVSKTVVKDSLAGAYCISPDAPDAEVDGDCSGGAFCATTSSRYDGFHFIAAGELPDDDTLLMNAQSGANSRSRDALNHTRTSPGSCNPACGGDCLPCIRFLREKQYTDFLGGSCSPPDSVVDPSDIRRYPRPAVTTPTGERVLPLGLTYSIARRPGLGGGAEGACGSTYAGGDGKGLRDIALATGGRAVDICSANNPSGFADFFDQMVVDAQGLGSPYRLTGNPISSTLRVGVLGKDGQFRIIRRSSVAGFDYNSTSRSIAFFAESEQDLYNAVSQERDDKVYVSYAVWERPCGEDCPLGDACSICTCSATSPECCTPTPTFICQAPTPCPQGCNPCEQCDPRTNTCTPVDACGGSCGAEACTRNGCSSCMNGTLVPIPCVPGADGECPDPAIEVCMSRNGVNNYDGNTCFVTTQGQPAQDCCGSEKVCDPDEVCVLKPCDGSGCLPTAECRAPSDVDFPLADWCGETCPSGTTCAPVPCPTEDCRPAFRCVADNPGPSATCELGPECGCPFGVCSDCPVGYFCSPDRQCRALCAPGTLTTACCTDPTLRVQALQCCPPGEHFDPATDTCQPGILCDPSCPDGFFCDADSGRCLPKGI